MSGKNSLLRLLNLDGVDMSSRRKKPQALQEQTPEEMGTPANPWVQAGKRVQAKTAQPAGDVPWQHALGEGRTRWYWRVARVLVIVVLLVVLLAGLRAIFFPPAAAQQAAEVPKASLFPTALAEGVSERFATSYLTWDEAQPQTRTAAMRQDMAGLSADDRLGWDGTGTQTASGARVVSVDATDDTRAIVTVTLSVSQKTPDGTTAAEATALAVPVAIVGERAVVTAAPVTVAVPKPGKAETVKDPQEDSALARSTQEYGESFFTAYGRDADVSSVSAPDAAFDGLGGIYTLDTVKTWTVFEGSNNNRQGRAVVQWITGSGAVIEQTYDLTLTRVSAGDTSRWQVAAVTGSTK